MDEQERYERAKRRVEEIRGFYGHLTAYVVVNAVLVALNLMTSPRYLWFRWPLFGWGIGLVLHAFSVFGAGRLFGPEWERRKIKEIMEREAGRDG
jgi:hypothetical protein